MNGMDITTIMEQEKEIEGLKAMLFSALPHISFAMSLYGNTTFMQAQAKDAKALIKKINRISCDE